MATQAILEVDVKSIGLRDEMRVYTTKLILSEFGERNAFDTMSWPVDFPQAEDVGLKYLGQVCTCLVNEIVKNISGVTFIVVDLHSVTILRNMSYSWNTIEPKLFEAIEKALKVDSEIVGKQLS
ncbi:hypothetical protein A3K01_01250 [candidate division WWE3 bacterium RIFOXYD1_FULL_43_17]|uniref:Uncharacterized protein n=3 Tax=Katanobacteria TaxID=422282 RepID=A0A1F4XB76_UNCKA|nr:MAG: hypothetical protein UU59_C0004G0037 [candidate division WWE3 bacterium GW2011_GWE1_41_27]KKS60593.1 MAG: hypothetical protein UV26_C0003G0047 [candidate division WWE3 bacterium GW2011_GWF2_42_42]OGC78926.1 MAG: hypothetical protein A3K01_01250 [candidate division WWE3 bacterium RIFOXYD1_FULL_43_17]